MIGKSGVPRLPKVDNTEYLVGLCFRKRKNPGLTRISNSIYGIITKERKMRLIEEKITRRAPILMKMTLP